MVFCKELPEQFAPPNAGTGLSQSLDHEMTAPSQVTGQELRGTQADQSPSTAMMNCKLFFEVRLQNSWFSLLLNPSI